LEAFGEDLAVSEIAEVCITIASEPKARNPIKNSFFIMLVVFVYPKTPLYRKVLKNKTIKTAISSESLVKSGQSYNNCDNTR
jgi:hypothetical protein